MSSSQPRRPPTRSRGGGGHRPPNLNMSMHQQKHRSAGNWSDDTNHDDDDDDEDEDDDDTPKTPPAGRRTRSMLFTPNAHKDEHHGVTHGRRTKTPVRMPTRAQLLANSSCNLGCYMFNQYSSQFNKRRKVIFGR